MQREEMDEEIKQNKFLEYGENNGNLYGTHLNSVKEVINSGNSFFTPKKKIVLYGNYI